MLAKTNKHPRDEKIVFQEEGHQYTITGLTEHPISVTTLIHLFFPEFDADVVIPKMMARNWANSKYFGMSPEAIKTLWEKNGEEASHAGTLMHADIERFLNQETVLNPTCTEHQYFQCFWKGFQVVNPCYVPYRTEWLVFDEERKISGSIDCVLKHVETGAVTILDWKRSKEIKKENRFEQGFPPFEHLPNCNFSHYTLQLNIYRHLLETKYEQRVAAMYILVFHPNAESFALHVVEKYDIAGIWTELTEKAWVKFLAHPKEHKILEI